MTARQMRLYNGVAFWIERNGTDGQPVSSIPGPARRVEFASRAIQGVSGSQNGVILSGVALGGADVTDAAVAMIEVVPTHEIGGPGACLIEVNEAFGGELWPVLGGTKQRLGIGVIVADAGPGVRGFDAQPVEHRQYRRGLERRAVVAVQHWLGAHRGNPLGQRGAAHQVRGMVGVIGIVHLPAHDLAAVQIQNQIQVEPASHHLCRQVRHVPAPHLPRCGGDVRGRRSDRLGRLGAPTMGGLPVRLQHTAERGFAGQIDAFIGKHGHDACRWHGSKARLVGHGKQVRTLGIRQGMGRWRAHGLRPEIAVDEAISRLPALEGAQIDAGNLAGRLEPGAGGVRHINVSGQGLAIFEADHSPSPLLKIAATFFDRTSSAAVSARARSLRSSSRSSSLMRFLSCRVACGLARASSGSASAVVALRCHLSSSAGYTPCSRHQELLPASSRAAAVITASSLAPAVQVRPGAGLDCTSSRHRSNVCTVTPISFAAKTTLALSGGNKRATTLFLNASPYRAIVLPYRPQVQDYIEATTILTRGAGVLGGGVRRVGVAASGHADALAAGIVAVVGGALFGGADRFGGFKQVAFAVVAVLGDVAVLVGGLGDIAVAGFVLAAGDTAVRVDGLGDVVPLVACDGGVQAAGVNIKAIVRTQRSTNHGGMGAPWGGRVVGRCLGHRLFSSYFVL